MHVSIILGRPPGFNFLSYGIAVCMKLTTVRYVMRDARRMASRPLAALAEISIKFKLSSLLGKGSELERYYKSEVTSMSLRTSQTSTSSPGPSYREDDMYKVQSSPNQSLRPILFPFKVGCVLLSVFLGKCLQSLFTTATTTCGMLGCIKFVGTGFLFICAHVKSDS
jgi:hypothetical protein